MVGILSTAKWPQSFISEMHAPYNGASKTPSLFVTFYKKQHGQYNRSTSIDSLATPYCLIKCIVTEHFTYHN